MTRQLTDFMKVFLVVREDPLFIHPTNQLYREYIQISSFDSLHGSQCGVNLMSYIFFLFPVVVRTRCRTVEPGISDCLWFFSLSHFSFIAIDWGSFVNHEQQIDNKQKYHETNSFANIVTQFATQLWPTLFRINVLERCFTFCIFEWHQIEKSRTKI